LPSSARFWLWGKKGRAMRDAEKCAYVDEIKRDRAESELASMTARAESAECALAAAEKERDKARAELHNAAHDKAIRADERAHWAHVLRVWAKDSRASADCALMLDAVADALLDNARDIEPGWEAAEARVKARAEKDL
jgi:hypothetical protein